MESLSQLYRSESAYQESMQNYDDTINRWDIPPESVFVDTRFGKTHVLRIGDESKPPFVFFHGWSGNAAGVNAELDIIRLAQYFQLHFVDTIGQSGKSAPARPDTEDSSYGDWGADVLASLGLTDVYLAGVSGGGYLSLKTASVVPDKIHKIFLMVPGGFVDLSRINFRFILSVIPAALGFEWGGRYFVRKMLSPNFKDNEKVYEMGEGMRNVLGKLKPVNGPKPLSDAELQRIPCPIYIVVGKYDIAVNPQQTIKRARRLLPDAIIKMVDSGHMIGVEKYDWITDEMLDFFEVESG